MPLSSHTDLTVAPVEFYLLRSIGVIRASACSHSAGPPPGHSICCPDPLGLFPGHWSQAAAHTGQQGPGTATGNVSRTLGQLCILLSPELFRTWAQIDLSWNSHLWGKPRWMVTTVSGSECDSEQVPSLAGSGQWGQLQGDHESSRVEVGSY